MAEKRDTIKDFHDLLVRIAGHYKTPEECAQWFRLPQPLINHEIPLDLIAQGRADELHRVWDRIDEGVFL